MCIAGCKMSKNVWFVNQTFRKKNFFCSALDTAVSVLFSAQAVALIIPGFVLFVQRDKRFFNFYFRSLTIEWLELWPIIWFQFESISTATRTVEHALCNHRTLLFCYRQPNSSSQNWSQLLSLPTICPIQSDFWLAQFCSMFLVFRCEHLICSDQQENSLSGESFWWKRLSWCWSFLSWMSLFHNFIQFPSGSFLSSFSLIFLVWPPPAVNHRPPPISNFPYFTVLAFHL